MFKLMKEATYWWPVKIKRPSETTPGEFEESTLRVRYRYFKESEHDALLGVLSERAKAGTPISDADFSRRVVCELGDVAGEDGQLLPPTPQLLNQVLDEPGVARAIVQAYFDSRLGVLEKN